MKTTEFFLPSRHDQLPLSVLILEPVVSPVGIVQILHGMCEHKERYLPFMEFLISKGYVCIIHDHRGHGQSIRSEEDHGFFYEKGAAGLIQDAAQVNRYIGRQFPDLPLYLLGHSMGSLIARCLLKRYPSFLDGLIVSGCPSNNSAVRVAADLVGVLQKQAGAYHRSEKIYKMVFDHFSARWPEEGKNAWICSDPQVQKAFEEDPDCGFVFTLNGFEGLFRLMNIVYSGRGWRVEDRQLPIWFLSGEDDPCMISRAKLVDALSVLQLAGYEDVTYRIYEGMRHEILNEIDKQRVFDDIYGRLERWRSLPRLPKE